MKRFLFGQIFISCLVLSGCDAGVFVKNELNGYQMAPRAPKLRSAQGQAPSARLSNYGAAIIASDSVLSLWGDACRPILPMLKPRGRMALRDALEKATGHSVVGHDQERELSKSTLTKFREGDLGGLAIICVGWSDAAEGLSDISENITNMIDLAHAHNVPVAVILPPLISFPPLKKATAPSYERNLTDRVAALNASVKTASASRGAAVIDGQTVLAPDYGPNLRNGLTDLAIARLGNAVADRIEVSAGR